MQFDGEEFKNERLMMSEKLTRTLQDQEIPIGGQLFHTLAYIYVES